MPYHSRRFLHLPHWHANWRLPGLTGLYLNATLRSFAIAMINVFIPLFILKQTASMKAIFIYYFYLNFLVLLFTYPAAVLVHKIGPDISMLMSSILLGFYLLCMLFIKVNLNFLFLAALLQALITPLYWLPYHLAFVKLGKEEKYGESIGFISVLGRITTALGPVIGGIIIVAAGFERLFGVIITLVLISTIPIFFDGFKRTSTFPSLIVVIKGLFVKDYRNNLWAFWGSSWESYVVSAFWPIFIFQMVMSYKTVGLISSLALMLSMVALWWAGRQVDKKGPGVLKIGMFSNSANWLVRVFLNSGWQIFLADFLYNLGDALLQTPFSAVMYKKAAESSPFEFFIKRELALYSGGVIAVIIVWLLWLVQPSWFLTFSFGGLGLLLTGLMIKRERE